MKAVAFTGMTSRPTSEQAGQKLNGYASSIASRPLKYGHQLAFFRPSVIPDPLKEPTAIRCRSFGILPVGGGGGNRSQPAPRCKVIRKQRRRSPRPSATDATKCNGLQIARPALAPSPDRIAPELIWMPPGTSLEGREAGGRPRDLSAGGKDVMTSEAVLKGGRAGLNPPRGMTSCRRFVHRVQDRDAAGGVFEKTDSGGGRRGGTCT
jgi:hypothetical protein